MANATSHSVKRVHLLCSLFLALGLFFVSVTVHTQNVTVALMQAAYAAQ